MTILPFTKHVDLPKYPILDVIRFGASLLVVLNHLRGNQFLPYSDVQCSSSAVKCAFFVVTRLGVESVVMFFVLSGFLVGGNAISRFVRGAFDGRKYFVDRVTRIYVPLIPAILLSAAGAAAIGQPIAASELLTNAASLQGAFGPPLSINMSLWSLAYEVWFYALCGGLVMLFQQEVHRKWLAFVLVATSAVVFSRLEAAYLFAWLLGACAFPLKARKPLRLLVIGMPFVAAGVAGMQLTSVSKQVDLSGFSWVDRPLAVITLAAGAALCVAAASGVECRTPRTRQMAALFQWLSSFSYTLYLIHTPIIIMLFKMRILEPFESLTLYSVAAFILTSIAICVTAWLLAIPFEFQTSRVRGWIQQRDSCVG